MVLCLLFHRLLGSFFRDGYFVLVGHVSRVKDIEKAAQVQPIWSTYRCGGVGHATGAPIRCCKHRLEVLALAGGVYRAGLVPAKESNTKKENKRKFCIVNGRTRTQTPLVDNKMQA